MEAEGGGLEGGGLEGGRLVTLGRAEISDRGATDLGDAWLDASVVVDRRGNVIAISQARSSATTSDGPTLIGRNLLTVLGPSHSALIATVLRFVLKSDQTWRGDVAPRECSTLSVDTSVRAIRDDAGRVTSFAVRTQNVTFKRRYEAVSAALNFSENLGLIFGGIRHELGNPVNSIKSALSVLRQNLDRFDRPKVEHYLDRVLAEVGRIEYLLLSLRTYNTLEVPEPEPLDLNEFLSRFHELVRRDMENRGIDFNVVAEAGLTASADPRALHQVLLNLVSNAVDAVEDTHQRLVTVTAQHTSHGVALRVYDSGVGIAPCTLPLLFRPFHTTKKGGTGLGLVISKRLLAQMSATIDVDSELGRGTCFRVCLAEP